jgi:hypothetical protein
MEAGRAPGSVGGTEATMNPAVAEGSFRTGPFDGVVCASNAFGGAHAAFLLSHV